MTTRPFALAAATALLVLFGVALVLAGAVLLVLASGRIPLLDSPRSVGAIGLIGAGAFVAAWFTWESASSLWRGRARGWSASLVVAVVAVGAALTLAANAGAQAPVVVGVIATAATVLFLLLPSTRRAAGVA